MYAYDVMITYVQHWTGSQIPTQPTIQFNSSNTCKIWVACCNDTTAAFKSDVTELVYHYSERKKGLKIVVAKGFVE